MALDLSALRDNYVAAVSERRDGNYSDIWDKSVYSRFAEFMLDPAVWEDFQGNGFAEGMGYSRNFKAGERTVPLEFTDPGSRARAEKWFRDLRAKCGTDFVDRLLESRIGRPPTVETGGVSVSFHDLRLVYNAWVLDKACGILDWRDRSTVFMEIGAGYGGLPCKIKTLFPRSKYIVIDLPEANAIQAYYIENFDPSLKVFRYLDFKEIGFDGFLDGDFDIALLPTQCIDMIGDRTVDFAINIRSLTEMTAPIVDEYFRQIHRVVRESGAFYNANRFDNRGSGDHLQFKTFPYDSRWTPLFSSTAWTQYQIHELVTVRTAFDVDGAPVSFLADLPPYGWGDVRRGGRDVGRKIMAIVFGLGQGTGNPGWGRTLLGQGENPDGTIARARRSLGRVKRGLSGKFQRKD